MSRLMSPGWFYWQAVRSLRGEAECEALRSRGGGQEGRTSEDIVGLWLLPLSLCFPDLREAVLLCHMSLP